MCIHTHSHIHTTHNSVLSLFLLSMTFLFSFYILQLVFGIVMNTISIFVAIIGIIIFAYEFPAFEALGSQYIWSNVSTNFNDNSVIVLDINKTLL